MKAGPRNFHVPLPEEMHTALRDEAAKSGRPATALAREAIEAFLRRRQKIALHESIASYARTQAGTRSDLDPELERAAIERLIDDEDGS